MGIVGWATNGSGFEKQLLYNGIHIAETAFAFRILDIAETPAGFNFFCDLQSCSGFPCCSNLFPNPAARPVKAVADVDILSLLTLFSRSNTCLKTSFSCCFHKFFWRDRS